MCLKKFANPQMKTAVNDIKVWKLLCYHSELINKDNNVYTPFRDVMVKPGDVIVSREKPCEADKFYVEGEGVHAYLLLNVALDEYFRMDALASRCIYRKKFILVSATIPKGESYYVGDYGDVASGSLVLSNIGNDFEYVKK